jgi:hypothetical protein
MKLSHILSVVFAELMSLTTNAQSLEATVKGNNAFALKFSKRSLMKTQMCLCRATAFPLPSLWLMPMLEIKPKCK